jgi:hypothetical protein
MAEKQTVAVLDDKSKKGRISGESDKKKGGVNQKVIRAFSFVCLFANVS